VPVEEDDDTLSGENPPRTSLRDSPTVDFHSGDDDRAKDEWLSPGTAEVLAVYAPPTDPGDAHGATPSDMEWISGRRGSLAKPPVVGPTSVVGSDIGLRTFLRDALRGTVEDLYDHPNLGGVVRLMMSRPLQNAVLLDPVANAQLFSDLKRLREQATPPRIIVVSNNRGLEVIGGVDMRIPPTESDGQLIAKVIAALRAV
jgi:hypothetical protein